MRHFRHHGGVLLALVLGLGAAAPAVQAQAVLLVHLPSVPLEAGNRTAEAVNAFGRYLAAESGIELEVKIFRRWQDAVDFLGAERGRVGLVLSDPSFLLDLEESGALVPSFRFVRAGEETYRRLLVVHSGNAELSGLAALRGKRLSVVETSGPSRDAFLERAVFSGQIDPAEWFEIKAEQDDFSATAAVLFRQADAALVAEFNPLLESNLGGDLRAVFESPPLSLPVLSLAPAVLGRDQRAALGRAATSFASTPEGRAVFSELKIDAIRPVEDGSGPFDRQALLRLPALPGKRMEIALPASGTLALSSPGSPKPADLSFALTVELPEVPIPTDP